MATFGIGAFEVFYKLGFDIVLENLANHVEHRELDFACLEQERPKSLMEFLMSLVNFNLSFLRIWLFLELSNDCYIFFNGRLHSIAHPLNTLNRLPDDSNGISR